jgi:antirestriction protein ArdC
MATPIEIVVSNIIKRAESEGKLPWHKPWQALMVPPQNGVSGNEYSGCNRFITMADSRSPFFFTSAAIKKLGGSLSEDAIPYQVVKYKPMKSKDKDTGKEKRWFKLFYHTVYNHADTFDIVVPESATNAIIHHHNPIAACADMINQWGARPRIEHGGDRAFYRPSEDLVQMPIMGAFNTAESYYDTLFHELAHSTGANKRLNRDLSGRFKSKSYSKEELVAELTACLLRIHCQIDSKDLEDNSVAYLQGWAKALKDDPNMFTYASAKAQAAFNMITNAAEFVAK